MNHTHSRAICGTETDWVTGRILMNSREETPAGDRLDTMRYKRSAEEKWKPRMKHPFPNRIQKPCLWFGATCVESISRVLLHRSSSKARLSSSDRQRIGFYSGTLFLLNQQRRSHCHLWKCEECVKQWSVEEIRCLVVLWSLTARTVHTYLREQRKTSSTWSSTSVSTFKPVKTDLYFNINYCFYYNYYKITRSLFKIKRIF